MLSDKDIGRAQQNGLMMIERDGELAIQQSSIDLHLEAMASLSRPSDTTIVDVTDESTYPDTVPRESMIINPHEFLLASVEETVDFSSAINGKIRGRSSVGRLGLFVHNAGLVDAGFTGGLTLELFNATTRPIKLKEGMRICQLTVDKHDTPTSVNYGDDADSVGGKYNEQRGPTPSKLYEDFESTGRVSQEAWKTSHD